MKVPNQFTDYKDGKRESNGIDENGSKLLDNWWYHIQNENAIDYQSVAFFFYSICTTSAPHLSTGSSTTIPQFTSYPKVVYSVF